MKRGLTLILALAVTAFTAWGCGGGADENQLRFRFWGSPEETEILTQLVKEFEAANPGITVKAERKPASQEYADALISEFAANRAPDVIFVSTDNVEQIRAAGALAPLDEYMTADGVDKNAYYKGMVDRFSEGGKLFVLPRDIAPIAVVYFNKTMFRDKGVSVPTDDWTWEDLRQKAIKLTERTKEGRPVTLGFGDDWPMLEPWVLSNGGGMVDDYNKPSAFTFADKAALDGIIFKWRLYFKDKAMPSSADQQALSAGGNRAYFLNGQLAMFLSGIWVSPEFRKIQKFDWDIVRFPKPSKNAQNVRYPGGGAGYAMNKFTKQPDLAWKLVKFMSGEKGQAMLARTGLAQPAIVKMAESNAWIDGQKPLNKKMLLEIAHLTVSNAPNWEPWVVFTRSMWGPKTDPVWSPTYEGSEEDVRKVYRDLQTAGNEKFFNK